MSTKSPVLTWAAVVVGVALIVLAVVYWIEPAGSLPSFIPGHEAGSGHHHVKHGIAAFFVGRGAARLRLVPDRRRQSKKPEPSAS